MVGSDLLELSHFVGADFAPSLQEALLILQQSDHQVLVYETAHFSSQDLFAFAETCAKHKPLLQHIIKSPHSHLDWVLALMPTVHIYHILHGKEDPSTIVDVIQKALEEYQESEQTNHLLTMMRDQTEKLQSLRLKLENRVKKRQQSLHKAEVRLRATNKKIETLHSALLAVHRASSVGEMEVLLAQALGDHLDIQWVRILTEFQSLLSNEHRPQSQFNVYEVPLSIAYQKTGTVLFARPANKSFDEDDADFLHQIVEAISLAMARMAKLQEAEILQQQWDATFNAISEPICLVDNNLSIVKTNQAYCEQVKKLPHQLNEQHGLKTFFPNVPFNIDLSLAQERWIFRQNKKATEELQTYEVLLQKLLIKGEHDSFYLIFFNNITEDLKNERQILENSKMAELGTIGSSIAHELNNPIGGILSFLQLIKADLLPSDPVYQDVAEMEQGALKCRDIVQSLLGFSRRTDSGSMQPVDLKEVLEQALKLTELKSRSQGIRLNLNINTHNYLVLGQANYLIQAIKNILQNSIEALILKQDTDTKFQGQIDVSLKENPSTYILTIEDNGVGIPANIQKKIFNPLFTTKGPRPNAGLGLTVSYKIVQDHKGSLEISSQPDRGTSAKITLQRPDLANLSQVFDGKI